MLLANIKNVDQLIFELVKLGYKRGEDLESLCQESAAWADFNTYTFTEPLTFGYHDVVYCVQIAPRKIIHEGAWQTEDEDELRSTWFLEALYFERNKKKEIFHWRLIKIGGDVELYIVVPAYSVSIEDLDQFIKYKIRMLKADMIKESC
jgi:hypothetical protein